MQLPCGVVYNKLVVLRSIAMLPRFTEVQYVKLIETSGNYHTIYELESKDLKML
jgi:hypothetical protein